MRTSLQALVALLVLAVSMIAGAQEPLLRREVNQKNPGGKDLVMTFQEMRRDDKTSTVKITMQSGASVPSSLFIARGFYDIANARGAAYFIKLQDRREPDGSWTHVVGFTQDKTVDPQKHFGLAEPLPKSRDSEFVSVRDFDVLFKGK